MKLQVYMIEGEFYSQVQKDIGAPMGQKGNLIKRKTFQAIDLLSGSLLNSHRLISKRKFQHSDMLSRTVYRDNEVPLHLQKKKYVVQYPPLVCANLKVMRIQTAPILR